ncbi:MAG: hypothetical protein ACKODX_05230, partial [Gemmata sp.]
MTEAQWRACGEPGAMLDALGRRASRRKLRLFACACCRRADGLFPDDQCRAAVAVAERAADGRASESEASAAGEKLGASVGAARDLLVAADAAFARNRTPATAARRALLGAAYSAALSARAATQSVLRVVPLGTCAAAAAGGRAAALALR